MVRSLAVMPDGNRVISAGTDGTLRLWDIETGQNLAVVGGRLGHVLSLIALPDRRCVVSGDYDRVGACETQGNVKEVWKLYGPLSPFSFAVRIVVTYHLSLFLICLPDPTAR